MPTYAWETAGRRELARLDGAEPGAACLSFSPDNGKLIVGGKAHTPEEYLVVDSLVPRAQTLALAVARLT